MTNENTIHPLWAGFNRLHWIVALILLLLLLLPILFGNSTPWRGCAVDRVDSYVAPAVVEREPVVEAAPVVVEPEPVAVISPYTLTATVDAARNAVLEGYVPDQASMDAILAAAAANYGPNVVNNLVIDAGAPEGWTATAVAAVEQVNRLANARIEMSDLNVNITGQASSESEMQSVRSDLSGVIMAPFNGSYTLSVPAPDISLADLVVEGYALVDEDADARVYFETGSYDTPLDVQTTLSEVVAALNGDADLVAVVSGFHDATGDYQSNQELAFNRAKAVRADLNAAGIDNTRIIMEKPEETTGSGDLAEARRVEVLLAYRQ